MEVFGGYAAAVLQVVAAGGLAAVIGMRLSSWNARARTARRRGEEDARQYQKLLATLPYQPKRVMNASERRLYAACASLARANGWIVLAQVRLADFVELSEGHDREGCDLDRRAWREIAQKHADVLVVDKKGLMPVCVLECDGPAHVSEASTIRNDLFKDALFAKAGIPVVRIAAGDRVGDAPYVARKMAAAGVTVALGKTQSQPAKRYAT